jgi:hypothetical protein
MTKSPSRMERMPHRISGLRIREVQRVRLSRRTQHGQPVSLRRHPRAAVGQIRC